MTHSTALHRTSISFGKRNLYGYEIKQKDSSWSSHNKQEVQAFNLATQPLYF